MSNPDEIDAVEPEVERLHAAFRRCFRTAAGEAVLVHLERTFNTTTSFVPGDPYKSAFNEGRRALFLEIKSLATEKE